MRFALAALILTLPCCTLPGTANEAPMRPDILLVGEIHDNPHHHARQAEIAASHRPAAIVFEMIEAAQEERLNGLVAAGASREG
ncbi:MAG TPA: ChaN family lipoprotein, partial [Paracoccaceae bacterium]|nr:ChaN family lipoprotein [Paracoccaceae bacterium]